MIPAATELFIAPELILHYVEEHRYCPPQSFIDAVRQCPEQGSREYLLLVRRYLHHFPEAECLMRDLG